MSAVRSYSTSLVCLSTEPSGSDLNFIPTVATVYFNVGINLQERTFDLQQIYVANVWSAKLAN